MKMNIVLSALLTALVSTGMASKALGDEAPPPTTANGWYLSIGEVSFDEAVALREGVEDTAVLVRAAWEGQTNAFVYGAGLSMFFYDDKQSFEQYVEGGGGGVRSADSSASAYNLFLEGGYSHTLNPRVNLEVLGGVELTLSSERSIGYCSNCYEEDIDIESGPYVMPRVRFSTAGSFSFFLAYQQYLSGDVENAVSANFSWRY